MDLIKFIIEQIAQDPEKRKAIENMIEFFQHIHIKLEQMQKDIKEIKEILNETSGIRKKEIGRRKLLT